MSQHKTTEFDGKKAIVTDKSHPHYEATAVCMGADLTNVGWGMKFKNTNSDEEFYVFNGKQVKWIN